jgi:S-DNA-T family DNA segregation ATPase FtsK/SpoIIIE
VQIMADPRHTAPGGEVIDVTDTATKAGDRQVDRYVFDGDVIDGEVVGNRATARSATAGPEILPAWMKDGQVRRAVARRLGRTAAAELVRSPAYTAAGLRELGVRWWKWVAVEPAGRKKTSAIVVAATTAGLWVGEVAAGPLPVSAVGVAGALFAALVGRRSRAARQIGQAGPVPSTPGAATPAPAPAGSPIQAVQPAGQGAPPVAQPIVPRVIADCERGSEAMDCVRAALLEEGIQVAAVNDASRFTWGWEVTATLAKGKPAQIIAKAAELETLLGLPADGLLVQPTRQQRGKVVLRAVIRDPFAEMKPLPYRAPDSLSIRDMALLAMRMDGADFTTSLNGVNILLVGISRAGKSVTMRTLAEAATACRDAVVWDLNPAADDLAPLAKAIDRVERSKAGIELALSTALAFAKGRPMLFNRLDMGDVWQPSPTHPALVIFLDEYPQLSKEAKNLAIAIARIGLKSRIQLVLGTQDSTADVMGDAIADSFAVKIMLPCRTADVTNVLGPGSMAEGWRPDRLHPAEGDHAFDAGKAYISGAGSHDPLLHKFYAGDRRDLAERAGQRAGSRPVIDTDTLSIAKIKATWSTPRKAQPAPEVLAAVAAWAQAGGDEWVRTSDLLSEVVNGQLGKTMNATAFGLQLRKWGCPPKPIKRDGATAQAVERAALLAAVDRIRAGGAVEIATGTSDTA